MVERYNDCGLLWTIGLTPGERYQNPDVVQVTGVKKPAGFWRSPQFATDRFACPAVLNIKAASSLPACHWPSIYG